MKLKYKFVVRNVAGQSVALAIGNANNTFNGMIKLNSVGEFIFKLLENDVTTSDIITSITEKYDVDSDTAAKSLDGYLNILRENGLLVE